MYGIYSSLNLNDKQQYYGKSEDYPVKVPAIDMTAMCDVAFLLLSFFILATKQKPPEAVTVVAPNSVSSKRHLKNQS